METFVNKVADSGIITINLEDYFPKDLMIFDLKSFLFMELILKEKDYRAALLAFDWSVCEQKNVVITCSVDAIIPVWAYMLAANYLQNVAKKIWVETPEKATELILLEHIQQIDENEFVDKRVVIKGCGEVAIAPSAYAAITAKLKPVVKSIMYGEPCSTVPIYKKKKD
jgi:hypothetical protein